ncbi:MAG: hypothetical protein HZA72_01905 [Candidatus Omnitrophica bacterium]|nr:hypothetical protein [Candidatus Omnitrophota bacterium]
MEKNIGKYFGYVLMTLGGSLGAAFANDLIVLLCFWGFLALPLYVLVAMRGTNNAAASAKKSLIVIGGTDALMILGIGLMWKTAGTFVMDKIHLSLSDPSSLFAYITIAIASFAKAGVIPFHSWLPDVAEDGPAPVAAYLPASLDKLLGIYLLARASLNLFVMNNISNLALLIIGSLTVIIAVMMALVQHNFKRLLGYHAVSQVGYMVLGIGTGNPIGIAGGLFHMLNNAVYKSCLFLSAGVVEKKTGTTDLSKLGGLAKYLPVTFICFLIASFSISGIPPFNGFVSKWMIYQGIIKLGNDKNPLWILWLVCAMFGSALTLASFMKLLHAVFLGRPSESSMGLKEAPVSMVLPMIILAAICIIFGVFACAVPLGLFIIPAVGQKISYIGIWKPGIATSLIITGIVLGVIMYLFLLPKRSRTVSVFTGGERPLEQERISGVEFYDTIKDMGILREIYKKEETKSFDIYEIGGKGTFFLSGILQWLHNGILLTYLVWCLVGMLALFFILMR